MSVPIVPELGPHRSRMGTNRCLAPTSPIAPINRVPLFCAFLPIVSLTIMRRGNWLTLGDDREFTFDAWLAPRVWHWMTAPASSRDDLFYVAVSVVLCSFPRFSFVLQLDNTISRWRSIPDVRERVKGERREYRGLTHVSESPVPCGPICASYVRSVTLGSI